MPVTSQTLDVSIKAEVLNGVWETYGVDRDVEVMPETVSYEGDSWGCLKASFTLRRNPWAAWPDLSPFTPIEIEIGGVIVWIGRTEGAPLKAGAEAQINVQCGGWSQHLDDDLYKRVYIHSTLSDWKDIRSFLTAPLGGFPQAATVTVEANNIAFGWPAHLTLVNDGAVGVGIDLGEPCAAAIVLGLEWVNETSNANQNIEIYGSAAGVGESRVFLYSDTPGTGTHTVTATITPGTAYRYLWITAVSVAGGNFVTEGDLSVKIKELAIYSNTAYESGGSSVLRASTVIETALPYAPLLSTDLSQIDTAADDFDIPSLVLSTPQTPRQVAEAVNAFHLWVLAVDLERRMVFAPPSDEPEWQIGSWSGENIEDASAGEAADIYSAVVVTGTAANGEALEVTVTAAELNATTVVGERGFTRAKTISLSNATDETVMRSIGRVWLEDQLEVPYGGAITAPVGAIRAVLGGAPQHPSLVCRHVNQLLRVSHAVDPSSGGIGRDGRVVAVSYSHLEQTATLTLGARTDSVQALLERLAVTGEVGS